MGISSYFIMTDALKGSLFKLPFMNMVTKLRPFVHTFLKEASNYFEMYIYTMGERAYALEMAHLLDPGRVYFDSKVIAQGDCTQSHQKGLDVVLGQENAVLILDDTEQVWSKHKDNLISMERYHFFASSCKQFGYESKSLSELRSDESDTDGALATVLKVVKRELGENFAGRDARQARYHLFDDCIFISKSFTHPKTRTHTSSHLVLGLSSKGLFSRI
ncbi:putative protein-serine/threonine phosphatase [Helianthus annuus]|nr:putative protein-serine/threonine phosphatase [Helianthus annuus]